ncbi:MAG: TRAP transporter substrate-binding protein DctP [Deltaproteobacteria bacterium]|nr:TRAP transporter substrate-binding protein DctP [Deltaproteobacteria bacterium]
MQATRFYRALLCALALVLAAATTASAENYRWKIATLAPDGVGWARQVKLILFPWLTEITHGEMNPKVYWGGVMGDDEDYVKKMRIGQLDGAGFSGQGVNLAVPEMSVLELPFIFRDYDEVDYVKSKMRGAFDKLARENGYMLLAWIDQDFDQMYSVNWPLSKPEHFVKSRFLTWYGPLEEALLRSLGARPIPVNVPEITASIRQGVVDSSISPAIWMVGAQLYSKVRYVNPVRIRYSPAVILVTIKAWESLPQRHRQGILETRDETEVEFCVKVREENEKCLNAMIAYGVQKVEMTPDEVAWMKEATRPLWEQMAGELYPGETLEKLKAHLAEYRSKNH